MIVTGSELHRVYGTGEAEVRALDGVDVAIDQGRFVAVMGPTGSGKSTLMHVLAGLDRPTSGTVEIAGTEVTKLDDKALT
jgi:putative ABC transport system ATP-binding protein